MEENQNIDMERLIVEAAKRVFVRKGYKAATMSDVAAEVGIGRTALHYYFRTKDILFDAVFEQLLSAVLPNLDKVMDEPSTIMQKLPKMVDLYMGVIRKNQSFPNFVLSELNRDRKHLFRALTKDVQRIQPLIRLQRQVEEEMEAGLLRKMPVVDFFSSIASLVVFPFLVKDALVNVFMDNDSNEFEQYLQRCRDAVVEIMTNFMSPKC